MVSNLGKPSKKKPKKSLEFSKPGGGPWPIPNFFFDYFGFFLKALGKHWKWSDSSRNAKKKISLLWGVVPCTVRYHTVQNCTVHCQNLVCKFFFFHFWMNQDIFICFYVFLGDLKKTQNFGNFPNFRGGGGVRKVWKIPNFFGFFLLKASLRYL